jgi:hypothetical protein
MAVGGLLVRGEGRRRLVARLIGTQCVRRLVRVLLFALGGCRSAAFVFVALRVVAHGCAVPAHDPGVNGHRLRTSALPARANAASPIAPPNAPTATPPPRAPLRRRGRGPGLPPFGSGNEFTSYPKHTRAMHYSRSGYSTPSTAASGPGRAPSRRSFSLSRFLFDRRLGGAASEVALRQVLRSSSTSTSPPTVPSSDL